MDTVILAAAEDGRFDVVLFAYNFIQREKGEKILRACREKNMGTTLMKTNPVKFHAEMQGYFDQAKERGREMPERMVRMMKDYKDFVKPEAEAFKAAYGLETPEQIRDAAIKFVLSNPHVHTACPTINSFDALNAYLPLSGQQLKPREAALLADYESVYGRYYCRHACGECESACPHGVPVNTVMRYHHYFEAQGREKHAMEHYADLKGSNASVCSTCAGPCQEACSFGIPIQGLLIQAHEALSL
jgi:predicted aldo/keto reductase-like oxidoreductase